MNILYFYLFLLVHPYLGMWWKSFPKAGRQSWEALIPGYNYFIVFKLSCKKPFWALLLAFPGIHLVMWATANVSYIRRFGYYSFTDTLQGIFFPYYLMYKCTQEGEIFEDETNWSNSAERETRKWGDHVALFLSLPIIGHVVAIGIDMVTRDKPGTKSRVKEWGDSILFALVAASIIRTYVFEPFQIPTGSMEKTLLVGDFLFVNKLAYGSKVPVTPLSYPLVHNTVPWVNMKSYSGLEIGDYTRLPGFGTVSRYDVVVFNYPSGDTAVYDPRMPNGLMGHDYHGILNNEAYYQYQKANSAKLQSLRKNASDSTFNVYYDSFCKAYINNPAPWRKIARERLANGNFPEYMVSDETPEAHGGLIYRPVDKRENYIKRCVGIPGDTLEVINAVLYVNGKPAEVGENQCLQYEVDKSIVEFPGASEMYEEYGLENAPNQTRMDFKDADIRNPNKYVLTLTEGEKNKIEKDFNIKLNLVIEAQYTDDSSYIATGEDLIANINYFPKDFYINNTPTNFSKFVIPKKGVSVSIHANNIAWYRRIITAYEGHSLEEKKEGIFIDGKKSSSYTFGMNYYWLMGDNRYNSADSRVWGFVPEDHVVGRASLVWFSKSAYLGVRWERLFKWIE
ncbi:MAG: S26 family signal peptidase [Crocinitomicaceae bacterium]